MPTRKQILLERLSEQRAYLRSLWRKLKHSKTGDELTFEFESVTHELKEIKSELRILGVSFRTSLIETKLNI